MKLVSGSMELRGRHPRVGGVTCKVWLQKQRTPRNTACAGEFACSCSFHPHLIPKQICQGSASSSPC